MARDFGYIEWVNCQQPMFHFQGIRYLFLSMLFISTIVLFVHYKNLREEKSAVIQLATLYPNDTDFFRHSESAIAYFASGGKLGFFQNEKAHKDFAQAMGDLGKASDLLKGHLPANFDYAIWVEKSLEPLEFYNARVIMPEKDRQNFRNAMANYIQAFEEVLKHKDWKASITSPVQFEDSIHLEVRAVETALRQFEEKFIRDDFAFIVRTEPDAGSITAFELLARLEQLKWHRYAMESEYISIVRVKQDHWRRNLHARMETLNKL